MKWVPLKHLVRINARSLPETTDDDLELCYIDIGAVGCGLLLEEPQLLTFGHAPSRARRQVRAGDTLISTVRTYLRAVLPVREAPSQLVASTGFAVLTPGPQLDPRYLGWLAQSDIVVEKIVGQSVGVSYPAISPLEIGDLCVPLYSTPNQLGIAHFLDAETAHIDGLISKKLSLVELLGERSEKRQTEAACGRLNRLATRDSGCKWLGRIPAHWPVERLKFIARLESGHTPSRSRPELWENCTTPWLTLNDVAYLESHEFVEETANWISEDGLAASSARVLPAGTVVLSRDATVGRCGILARPMATSQHFVDWICSERLLPRYLWLLFSTAMQTHFDSVTSGATLRTIGMPDVKQLVVPVPPLNEQHEIVAEAEEIRTRADRGVGCLQRQIALLHERRQALITAAVTGELDIPGAA